MPEEAAEERLPDDMAPLALAVKLSRVSALRAEIHAARTREKSGSSQDGLLIMLDSDAPELMLAVDPVEPLLVIDPLEAPAHQSCQLRA